MPLLLTTMAFCGQLHFLQEWASSKDGRNLYMRLTSDAQDSQSVEQLALTMAVLMSYRRLFPDRLDHSDQPITGSYLADLDALFDGYSLGNSGNVWEQMVFALIRMLRSFVDLYDDLIMFLETVLDLEPLLLHVFHGFSDQYLCRRIKGQPHEAAIVRLSAIGAPKLGWYDDSDWVSVTHPEHLSLQEPQSSGDCLVTGHVDWIFLHRILWYFRRLGMDFF